MNRKTSLIFLTTLAISLLTGCCSDDQEETANNVIRFDTSVGGVNTRNTRGTTTTETFNAFNVTAFGDASVPKMRRLELFNEKYTGQDTILTYNMDIFGWLQKITQLKHTICYF